jgi:argininosuccinate synthase
MNGSPTTGGNPVLLAFSGGLDTSFCVAWLKETLGRPVITVTVDTGGDVDTAALEARALALGAERHITVDARREFFDSVIRYLVFGNVRRGQLYPLCVGAERGLQARFVAAQAAELGSDTVAHGSTAAGNDQVRFEVALRTLRPGLEVLAPVRDHDWQRADQVAWLEARGLPAPAGGGAYSINRGLWGTTIGGKETLDSRESIPESAWVVTAGAFDAPRAPARHRLGFERGVPVTLDGETLDPVALIERLEVLAGGFGIGRGIHLGETILGSKGRVAFEAPAAETILCAHRELEKLTLTGMQQKIKEPLALVYGDLVHEGQHLEPAARDVEALLASSQARVTGEVHLLFRPGALFVEGVTSPHSLLAATKGKYGESAGEWSAADTLGFARMKALSGMLHTRAGG